ncbi:glucokinase [Candidatus Vecturithrix granuli]|uniref:Glucokinase n=1 Tax=Vecturithrix granuli TaxID=1499967 RepID=A0A081C0B0_VECG1|nr:glucokinase [Candidatus Vecturithrix granuli]
METQHVFLGVDIGGTNVKIGVINQEGVILEHRQIPTNVHRAPENVIADIAAAANDVRAPLEAQGQKILSLGVGVPGSIDWQEGVCRLLPNFPNGWRDVRLKEQLERHLELSTFMINDVRAITLAEKLFGAGKSVTSMIMAAIGTGIGGGIVINNELLIGRDGSAGELGHMNVEPGGVVCGCGSRGCLECYASGPAIAGAALRALVQQNDTLIRELVKNDYNKVTAAIVAEAAERGDQVAKDILTNAGKYIGQAMANVAVVVNPEMVVIGGGVAQAGRVLFGSICKTFHKTLQIIQSETIQIRLSELGVLAGIQGSAAWGMKMKSA